MSICLIFAVPSFSQTPDPKLVELRNQFAQKYMQPEAHFALAKYYSDHGNYLRAFLIIEYARRYRFEEKDFNTAYAAYFGDSMPEPPDDAKTAFEAASKLVTQGKYDEAETYFQKALKIDDRSFFINAWVGRFYYKTRSDSSRALPYYFKAYFLYPDAYETEYVESRITRISLEQAKHTFAEQLETGKSLPELARGTDPFVVANAIELMATNWKPEYLAVMLECLSDDDSYDRWLAFVVVQKYAGPSLGQVVSGMMIDKDLRKRGLAGYAVVERPGQERFALLKQMLKDPAELLRFDAISALALKGGATGRQILKDHQRVEKQLRLKGLIDMALKSE